MFADTIERVAMRQSDYTANTQTFILMNNQLSVGNDLRATATFKSSLAKSLVVHSTSIPVSTEFAECPSRVFVNPVDQIQIPVTMISIAYTTEGLGTRVAATFSLIVFLPAR